MRSRWWVALLWVCAALWGCGALGGCGALTPPPPPTGCGACHAPHDGPPTGVHAALSCERCHLGDPAAGEEQAAHAGLELQPGALSSVDRTCGAAGCHEAQTARVLRSLMATNAGLVDVSLRAMGEAPTPGHGLPEVLAAAEPSPGQDHLRRLCGGCHLHARKENRDDAVQGIGSGCSACHSRSRGSRFEAHPAIDLVVPDDRCLGCHSRSGRISLGYQGLAELRGRACDEPVRLHDGRDGCRVQPDVHQVAGLACTDCHLHTELMGAGELLESRPDPGGGRPSEERWVPEGGARRADLDERAGGGTWRGSPLGGDLDSWTHQAQAVELRCESCHGPGAVESTWAAVEDPTSRTLLRMHGQTRPPEEVVRLGARGTPLWNLRPGEAGWALWPKDAGASRVVPQTPADADHQLPGHQRLSCAACHTAWAPTCADCHTRFDPQGEQWDFGQAATAPGRWVEEARVFSWGPPALGVTAEGRVDTFAPGMISTLDARLAREGEAGPTRSARVFSRVAPHTTGATARTCAGCHRDPVALGLGTGALDLQALRFVPAVEVPGQPGLAVDGWVPLQPDRPGQAGREGQRSLSAEEQRRLLRVGLCLDCHEGAQDPVFQDFPASLGRLRRTSSCGTPALPAWTRR